VVLSICDKKVVKPVLLKSCSERMATEGNTGENKKAFLEKGLLSKSRLVKF
jgi:hypothetical protein